MEGNSSIIMHLPTQPSPISPTVSANSTVLSFIFLICFLPQLSTIHHLIIMQPDKKKENIIKSRILYIYSIIDMFPIRYYMRSVSTLITLNHKLLGSVTFIIVKSLLLSLASVIAKCKIYLFLYSNIY